MLKLRNSKAFTLIELLVVVIIVAVLAAVATPLLAGNIQRARASEAEAGLGTIRTAMRTQFAEKESYPAGITGLLTSAANIGIKAPAAGPPPTPGDLDGRFFEDDDYTIVSSGGSAFCAQVTGDAGGTAPRGGQVAGPPAVTRSIDELGNIYSNNSCTPGLANVNILN